MNKLTFVAYGTPRPQGSKTPWGTECSPMLGQWKLDVAKAATEALPAGWTLIESAVVVVGAFYFKRSPAHYKRSGELKRTAPAEMTHKPDIEKLARGVSDALIGVVFKDDSQVVSWHAIKLWTDGCDRAEFVITWESGDAD